MIKFIHNNINLKCKRAKCPNLKTQTGKLDQESRPTAVLYQETHLICKDTYRHKIKGWRKIYQTNGEQEKAGVAALVFAITDFKPKKIKRDKEGALHNSKWVNTTRRANDPKYIHTQYISTQIHKASS